MSFKFNTEVERVQTCLRQGLQQIMLELEDAKVMLGDTRFVLLHLYQKPRCVCLDRNLCFVVLYYDIYLMRCLFLIRCAMLLWWAQKHILFAYVSHSM